MGYRIGVITSTEDLANEYRETMQLNAPDCEFLFRVGAMPTAIQLAQGLEEWGMDALIVNIATSRTLQGHISVPMLTMCLKNYDLVKAFSAARKMGKSIGFVAIETQTIQYDLEEVNELLGLNVRNYMFLGYETLPELVEQIIADGCDVVVTMGFTVTSMLRERGVSCILLGPSASTFRDVVKEALGILNARSEEARTSRWVNAVINDIPEGILTIDHLGYVVIYNQTIQEMLQISEGSVIGHNINELRNKYDVFSNMLDSGPDQIIFQYNGNEYVLNRQLVYLDNVPIGKTVRMQKLSAIQDMEAATRRRRDESGFVARNSFTRIQGNTPGLIAAKKMAMEYAKSTANVLITGESGSGKEIFAQSIHNGSDFRKGPFVAVNCSALTESLMESELFGYEEGAFTGAKKGGKPGLLELAHGGTFFLDEIGDMPLSLQVKLLRVLQERTVRRIGGSKNIPVRTRFIFATNRDLYQEVQEKQFRLDLFYRINVLPLHIPPLRERKGDIPEIARSIAQDITESHETVQFLGPESIQAMQDYDWPGNIRELHNFVERLTVLKVTNPAVAAQMLSETAHRSAAAFSSTIVDYEDAESLKVPIASLRDMEDSIITMLNERYRGDKKRLEQTLKISSTTLWRWFKRQDD